MRMAADYPSSRGRRKCPNARPLILMLDSALVRLLIRLLVLTAVFVSCLLGFSASSYQSFAPNNYPATMPVVIATGGGAAVLQWEQVKESPVPLRLADNASGCLDASHCVEVSPGQSMIRQRIAGGLAWWQQRVEANHIAQASVFRLTLVMAFPAFLAAAIVSQLVGWWLRRRARKPGGA